MRVGDRMSDLSDGSTSDALIPDAIKNIMRHTCDYQLRVQAEDQATSKNDINYEWVRGVFYTGLPAIYDVTGDQNYLDAAINYSESRRWKLDKPETRHADWQCVGQLYLELYFSENDPRMIEAIKENIDAQIADPKPGRIDWWWCDALFMAPPALVRLAKATGDKKYLTFLNTMFEDAQEFLYNDDDHLFYRDENYFNARSKNGQKVYWSRGNGWVLAGIARVLEYLPKDDPGRANFEKLFIDMSARIAPLQQPDGLWRTSLLDPDEFITSETSGSALFIYAMAWGINNDLLGRREYEPVVKKGWLGLAQAVNEDGRLGYVQTVAAAPGIVNPDDTREYAVGALLLAGKEILELTK